MSWRAAFPTNNGYLLKDSEELLLRLLHLYELTGFLHI